MSNKGYTSDEYRSDNHDLAVYHLTVGETYHHVHAIAQVPDPLFNVEQTVTLDPNGEMTISTQTPQADTILRLRPELVLRIVDAFNQAEREKAEALECLKHGCDGDHTIAKQIKFIADVVLGEE